MQPLVSIGELEVKTCRKRNIADILESGDVSLDKWYEAKVDFITLDEWSGTEKRTTRTMLVQSDKLPDALADLTKELEKQLGTYEVTSIKETAILEHVKY